MNPLAGAMARVNINIEDCRMAVELCGYAAICVIKAFASPLGFASNKR